MREGEGARVREREREREWRAAPRDAAAAADDGGPLLGAHVPSAQ